ncbi:MAG: hypothetical protein EBY20_07960 [Alphaproteobacteria bacterium]|nr:hypothetical protein [Alphaproteobacteria bacterium]
MKVDIKKAKDIGSAKGAEYGSFWGGVISGTLTATAFLIICPFKVAISNEFIAGLAGLSISSGISYLLGSGCGSLYGKIIGEQKGENLAKENKEQEEIEEVCKQEGTKAGIIAGLGTSILISSVVYYNNIKSIKIEDSQEKILGDSSLLEDNHE